MIFALPCRKYTKSYTYRMADRIFAMIVYKSLTRVSNHAIAREQFLQEKK